jgi:CheY-like chemotaxis protein
MTQTAVLVVEDEVLVRLLIADALRQSSFRVIEAANGYEARTILQSSNPVGVLITDVKIPIPGWDADLHF